MNLLKEDKQVRTVFEVNRKRCYEEILDTQLFSNVGNSFKRYCFGILFQHTVGIDLEYSNQIDLEVDAFARMHKLKSLQLNNVLISGSFENFPKGLR